MGSYGHGLSRSGALPGADLRKPLPKGHYLWASVIDLPLLIMQYAPENIIPVTLELGGKSPNIFFADVLRDEDAFVDKVLERFAMFALNQGEVCTCPSRACTMLDLRQIHGTCRQAGREYSPERSVRNEHADRRASQSALFDPLLALHGDAH
jgi:hypothetical protein